jgi:hypothetical protein
LSCGGPIEFEASFWANAGAPAAARPKRMKAAARGRRRIGGIETKTLPETAYPPPPGKSTASGSFDPCSAGHLAAGASARGVRESFSFRAGRLAGTGGSE